MKIDGVFSSNRAFEQEKGYIKSVDRNKIGAF